MLLGPLADDRLVAMENQIVMLGEVYQRAIANGASLAERESYACEMKRLYGEVRTLSIETGNPGFFPAMMKRLTVLEMKRNAERLGRATTPSSTKPTPKTVPASSSPNASSKRSSVAIFPHGIVPRRRHVAYSIVVVSVLAPIVLGLFVGISLIVVSICAAIQMSVMSTVVELGLASRRRRQEAAAVEASRTVAPAAPTYRQTLGTTYFEPYTDCPECGTEALHWIETPAYGSEFDDFDVVRTCRAEKADGALCGHRWGQNALGIAPMQPIQGCIDLRTPGKRESAVREAFDGVGTQDAQEVYSALMATPERVMGAPVPPSGCRPCYEDRPNYQDDRNDDDLRLYL